MELHIISGLPSSVTNLRANISSGSSVNTSWTAPWSLDVTGVDHDIWYSVLIQNVTDEDRPTGILCTDCTNITETHYTFTPDHLSPCHVYNFTIIPANGAGLGERSIISTIGKCNIIKSGLSLKVKVQIGIFECTGIMGQDLIHPYIQSTTVLCDKECVSLLLSVSAI